MQHLIQRQTIEITAPEAQLAKALQWRMDTLFKTHALPVMDEVFTDFATPKQVIRLEQMEVDLGTLSAEALEDEFVRALRKVLQDALQQQLSESGQIATAGEVVKLKQQQATFETVIYFLRHGVLPWWSRVDDAAELESLALKLLHKDTSVFIRQLRKAASQTVIERLLKQFSSTSYPMLLNALLASLTSSLAETVRQWNMLAEGAVLDEAVKLEIKVSLLRALLQQDAARLQPETLSKHILQRLHADESVSTGLSRLLINQAHSVLPKNSILYRWLSAQAQSTAKAPTADKTRLKPSRSSTEEAPPVRKTFAAEELADPAAQAFSTEQPGSTDYKSGNDRVPNDESAKARLVNNTEQLQPTEVEEVEWLNPEASYYIQNAGLVLLWPFLERFFGALELSEKGRFVSQAAQHKAVSMLHYLSNGEDSAYEHALLLNKLICGWPLSQPLWRKDELTARDKAEADALLSAVIEHWKVLKNTSVDGLRQAFLQREGRLTQQNESWELKIARSGFDVLLDQLPWSISTIRLPWMHEVVFVEW